MPKQKLGVIVFPDFEKRKEKDFEIDPQPSKIGTSTTKKAEGAVVGKWDK